MEAHLAAVGLGEGLAGDDLQQQHQLQAVAEVLLDVLDGCAGLPQVGVAPGGEGLRQRGTARQTGQPAGRQRRRGLQRSERGRPGDGTHPQRYVDCAG